VEPVAKDLSNSRPVSKYNRKNGYAELAVLQFFYQKNDLLQERIDREQKVIFFDLCPVCWSE